MTNIDLYAIKQTLKSLYLYIVQITKHNKSYIMRGQKKSELVLYAVLWAILFAAAAIGVYWDGIHPNPEEIAMRGMAHAHSYDVRDLLGTWRLLSLFCITFFIHNFVVAPLLVYRNKKWQYGICALLLMAAFVGFVMTRNDFKPRRRFHNMEWRAHRHDTASPTPPYHEPWDKRRGPRPMKAKPFGGPTTVAFTIMLLLLALNIGAKHYFKSLDDSKRMKDLERENLNQQLQYLKYQINPHFFMNTLNNIHALVDIDQEEAKLMIETLSKLMRYVLYEADKPMASLKDEIDFLNHYINLMKIRYADDVRISISMPTSFPNVQVPSLLLATFIENAFKHGVSCLRESFIEVCLNIDERSEKLCFVCRNSKKPLSEEHIGKGSKADKEKGGVGLKNALRRIKLIYGTDYEFKIEDNADDYRLTLRLPLR